MAARLPGKALRSPLFNDLLCLVDQPGMRCDVVLRHGDDLPHRDVLWLEALCGQRLLDGLKRLPRQH